MSVGLLILSIHIGNLVLNIRVRLLFYTGLVSRDQGFVLDDILRV